MINLLLILVVLIIFIIALFDLRKAICVYVGYLFLIPYMQIEIAGLTLSYNIVTTFFLVIYFIKYVVWKKEKIDYTIAGPLLIFYSALFLLTFIPRELPFSEQFPALRADFMNAAFVPIIIWQLYKSEKDLKILLKVIILCSIVMSIYGLICFVSSSNPYVRLFGGYLEKIDWVGRFLETSRSGFQGRVQSTTSHPMMWSALLFMFIYFIRIIHWSKYDRFHYILLTLFIINMIISGTRSGIFAFLAGFAYIMYFLTTRKHKIIILCFVFSILLIGIDTSIFGQYQEFADSIVGVFGKGAQTKGSSVNMRLEQINAGLKLITARDLLIGKGYYWTTIFMKKVGTDTIFLAFESIFLVVFIENGILGCLIWLFFFLSLLYLNRKMTNNKNLKQVRIYLNAFIFSYSVFILITGICGSFVLFLVIYTVLLRFVYFKKQIINKKESYSSDQPGLITENI